MLLFTEKRQSAVGSRQSIFFFSTAEGSNKKYVRTLNPYIYYLWDTTANRRLSTARSSLQLKLSQRI